MNRQNNLKIILTTVIVLVISAIGVYTVIHWADIVKKFQGAAGKNDGFEKHERNTVQPANTDTATSSAEKPNEVSPSQDEAKILHHPTESNTKSFTKFEEPQNPKPKDTPIGLDEPLPKKESFNPPDNEVYPRKADLIPNATKNFSGKNSVKSSQAKKRMHPKKYLRRHRYARIRIKQGSGLEKRVIFLEKKLGIKNAGKTKQGNLASRVYTLEKLITKKQK